MEIQFRENSLDHLRWAAWEMNSQKQTQEVRLADSLPDIGRILGVWGQPLIRSKEWRGGGMGATGGVMVWILYAPEDGSAPKTVETWVPVSLRWEFPQTQREGIIRLSWTLSALDGRILSARKLMVRCSLCALGEALEPVKSSYYVPGELPEDVRIQTENYPVVLPREAGEKSFSLEESLTLPGDWGEVEGLICGFANPEITEEKVMGDKGVFRGKADVRCLFLCKDGSIKPLEGELEFSQFVQLDRDYEADAWMDTACAVTNLEIQPAEDGTLGVKLGLVGQYVVYDRSVISLARDAYSTRRQLEMTQEALELPAVLESRKEVLSLREEWKDSGSAVDVSMTLCQPTVFREDGEAEAEVRGTFQVLAQTGETLRGNVQNWEEDREIPAAGNVKLMARSAPRGFPAIKGGEIQGSAEVKVLSVKEESWMGIKSLELGEEIPLAPDRPSLILRRAGDGNIWSLAKAYRTTPEAIREINDLQGEPEKNAMLLIPVS